MKLLLDECMSVDLRHELVGHDVFTVSYMKWGGTKNGTLLALAAANGFEALITSDRGLAHQQNPATLPIAIVILHVRSNDLPDVLPLVPRLLATLPALPPKSVTIIS